MMRVDDTLLVTIIAGALLSLLFLPMMEAAQPTAEAPPACGCRIVDSSGAHQQGIECIALPEQADAGSF